MKSLSAHLWTQFNCIRVSDCYNFFPSCCCQLNNQLKPLLHCPSSCSYSSVNSGIFSSSNYWQIYLSTFKNLNDLLPSCLFIFNVKLCCYLWSKYYTTEHTRVPLLCVVFFFLFFSPMLEICINVFKRGEKKFGLV